MSHVLDVAGLVIWFAVGLAVGERHGYRAGLRWHSHDTSAPIEEEEAR